jgi:hypothetical protein
MNKCADCLHLFRPEEFQFISAVPPILVIEDEALIRLGLVETLRGAASPSTLKGRS